MPSFRCLVLKHFPLAIPSYSPLLIFMRAKTPVTLSDGDSVCVSLTEVTDLEATDPATGQALFRLSWKPLGQSDSPGTIAKRVVKSRSAHRMG